MQFRTESIIHLLWVGDGGAFINSCPGASCALEARSIRHFSPRVPSLHPQHRAVPSHHGLQTNSSAAPKLFFCPARLVAAALDPNQNLHSSRCSPAATERHQDSAALHCGTPGPFLQRSAAPQCRFVLPQPKPRGATQTQLRCRCAYL